MTFNIQKFDVFYFLNLLEQCTKDQFQYVVIKTVKRTVANVVSVTSIGNTR